MKNTFSKLVVIATLMLPCVLIAQTSSINAFSPYSMYGIGEMNVQGTLPTRSMGGAGVAMRSPGVMNMLNPAAFSATRKNSFLFNVGLEGQNYYNAQTMNNIKKESAYNTMNFRDLSFQMPLSNDVGLGFSVTPYSSVGYRITGSSELSGDGAGIWTNSLYEGDGDITEVKLGVGWEIFKNFSLGVSVQYYWGSLERRYTMQPSNIIDNVNILSIQGVDNYMISKMKAQIGIQWSPILNQERILTLGATYDIGGDLTPKVTKSIILGDIYGTTVVDNTTQLATLLPRQVALGAYYQTNKLSLAFDYVYQNWGSENSTVVKTASGNDVAYRNTNTFKLGAEFTPNRFDVRNFLKRWSYRAGVRYGDYYNTIGGESLAQYAVTGGFGIPTKFMSLSAIDVGFEYGIRKGTNAATRIGLIEQQYFKVAIGFSLFAGQESGEFWFYRPKYD